VSSRNCPSISPSRTFFTPPYRNIKDVKAQCIYEHYVRAKLQYPVFLSMTLFLHYSPRAPDKASREEYYLFILTRLTTKIYMYGASKGISKNLGIQKQKIQIENYFHMQL
jgi:hypothetical protein